MNLQPALLFQLLASQQQQEAVTRGLLACIECGACSAVCPSGIALSHAFRLGKQQLQQSARKEQHG